jgi:hypothetical protein
VTMPWQAYELTVESIKQYCGFPAGESQDLIDAASRIFDLNLPQPVVLSQQDTEPTWYFDR